MTKSEPYPRPYSTYLVGVCSPMFIPHFKFYLSQQFGTFFVCQSAAEADRCLAAVLSTYNYPAAVSAAQALGFFPYSRHLKDGHRVFTPQPEDVSVGIFLPENSHENDPVPTGWFGYVDREIKTIDRESMQILAGSFVQTMELKHNLC